MSYTEALHFDMVYFEKLNQTRQMSAFGKCAELRLVRLDSGQDDEIV